MKKNYAVLVTESTVWKVIVEAESQEDAELLAEEVFHENGFVVGFQVEDSDATEITLEEMADED